MGYTKNTLDLLKLIGKTNITNKSIIEFGSQDIVVNIEDLKDFIKSFDEKALTLDGYLSDNFSRLSAKYLYDSISCKSYNCIDIDGAHGSFNFDLNYHLEDKYNFTNKYDIVTNLGTSEHIFNQYSCFENLHNLCKTDGFIIISLPIQGYSNHCFFNYHPTFFEHLADANKYEILYLDYAITSYHSEDDSKNISIIFRKQNSEDFVMPIQKTINKALSKVNKFSAEKLRSNFLAVTNINLDVIDNIAIFGTAQAGEKAYLFSKETNKNVLCFIDDFKSGNYKETQIPIISYAEFIDSYQNKIDLVIQGNYQNGNIQNRSGFKTELIELSSLVLEIKG